MCPPTNFPYQNEYYKTLLEVTFALYTVSSFKILLTDLSKQGGHFWTVFPTSKFYRNTQICFSSTDLSFLLLILVLEYKVHNLLLS